MTVNGQALGGDDPIVIVGMAARLPLAGTSLPAFWELIKEGRVAAREIPKTRFNVDAYYHPDPGRTNTVSHLIYLCSAQSLTFWP